MSKSVRRGDSFSFSSSSGLSRNSSDRSHKPPRFSLRRFFCRRPSSARAAVTRAVHSQSEIESQSESSLQGSLGERELANRGPIVEDVPVTYKKTKDGLECPVCMSCQPKENFPVIMTCHHRSCSDCLRKYLRIEITESRVNIACPECNEKFHPNDIKSILDDDELILKYEEFMIRRVLVLDPDTRWCPAPDCGYAVIASACASCPRLKCEVPGCNTYFCYHCKQAWHANQTCDAARAERTANLRSSSISYSHESGSQNDIKPCPRCSAFIVKMDDGSCNHMTCAVCGAEFCWLCMKEISDLHYLSPSGCTFWGKKPWSRKKKILWQLGTLVGAPVGITLIAGIAVPAIIIGVPVWVGKRLHSRYDYLSKHRRNLVVAGGVMSSILVSPIIAGLAVGIGVPILLAYVYGVVPISLCRSGGCGVTTTNSGGVRFDFDDEENAPQGATGLSHAGDTQSMETHNIANPSIGPSIGEMSMGMTNSLSASGSHLDRVGALRDDLDRDSASNRAIVGASLNGSISSGTVTGAMGYHNRLEIHADVSNHVIHKRSSISSESANFSLDAKSATVSFSDDASTKALAGSLCCRDKDNSSAVVPALDVQLDVGGTAVHYHNTDHTYGDSGVHKPHGGHGSPTPSRSVNFAGEEILGPGSSRRFPRHSVSVGNSICENVEQCDRSPRSSGSFMDNLSVGACSQGSFGAGSHGSYRGNSPRGSFTSDNLTSHHEAPPPSFTEVESDRRMTVPNLSGPRLLENDTSSESTSAISVILKDTALNPSMTGTNKPCQPQLSPVGSQHTASLHDSSSGSIASGVCETTVLIDGTSITSGSS